MKLAATKIAATFAAAFTFATATPALAQYQSALPAGAILPPYEVFTIVCSMGFDPISRPVLRGPVYVVRALDEEDIPVRVAVDAHSGNVVRVTEGGPYVPGGWRAARSGAYMMPPETIPPGAAYPPPREFGRETLPGDPERRMSQPAPHSAPKVAARTPLPRRAPPHAKPSVPSPAAAALADPKATPGKSVPAPVANRAAATAATATPPVNPGHATKTPDHEAITGAISPAGDTPTPEPDLKLVPVAPLE